MQKTKKENQQNWRTCERGFSLIEMMIVLAITLIMTAVLFAKKNESKAQANADAAMREVAARIRELQNEALSGKQVAGIYPNKFNFSAVDETSQYTISYINAAGNTVVLPAANLSTKKVKFQNATNGATTSFYFQSPRAEVAVNAPTAFTAGGNVQIWLQTTDGTVNRYICVSKSGNVAEQKTVCP